ncbi:MAG TPA: hypothetical protein VFJ92_15070, partial [Gemmatimonadales bacterium]|nr:hypothetical protein [Gemmatimonadales bacterium]
AELVRRRPAADPPVPDHLADAVTAISTSVRGPMSSFIARATKVSVGTVHKVLIDHRASSD